MAYPPPPYKDAVAGNFVAGEAIVGTWWAYPPEAKLGLKGVPPSLDIVSGPDVTVVPPPAQLALQAAPVALAVTSTLSPPQGFLGLGTTLPIRVGQPWLWPVAVGEIELAPAAATVIALAPAVATEVLLVPTLEETG